MAFNNVSRCFFQNFNITETTPLSILAKKKTPTKNRSKIAAYKPESVEEMHEAIKDVFGPMFETILNGEMENYLGYANNSKSEKTTENRRNGYSEKRLKTSLGFG